MAESSSNAPGVPAQPAWHTLALDWIKSNPLPAALFAALFATIGIFYGVVPLFTRQPTVFSWAWHAWNPETKYEHAKLVPFIILFLIWHDLPKLLAAKVKPSNLGWAPLAVGIVLYLLSARTYQPRVALAALPFLALGISLYLGGRQVTRVLLFPICCLFFLIPLPGVDQATVRLQLLVAKSAAVLCGFLGIHLTTIGTAIHATDQSFNFDIAGDCSGINSLMAITLMTAIFAHLSQDKIWKKLLLFAASAPVAVIGNIARIVSIMVVAKCFGQHFAGGTFHDVSAYIVSFPFAFLSLYLVHLLLNWRWKRGPRAPSAPATDDAPVFTPSANPAAVKTVSYDY